MNPLLSGTKNDVRLSTTLPISKKKVSYEAYTYKDRKIINKANATNDEHTILTNLSEMIASKTSLDYDEVMNLSAQDYEWLFIKLHVSSNGSITPARKPCPKCASNKDAVDPGFKISLNLNDAFITNSDNNHFTHKVAFGNNVIVFANPTFGDIIQVSDIGAKYKRQKDDEVSKKLEEFNVELNASMGVDTSINDPRKTDRIRAKRAELYLELAAANDDNDVLVFAPFIKHIFVGDEILVMGALNDDGSRPDGIYTIDDLIEFLEALPLHIDIEQEFENFLDRVPYMSLKYSGRCTCGEVTRGELRGITDFFASSIQ